MRRRGDADAVAVKDRPVELDVQPDERLRRIGEDGTEDVDEARVHIPGLALLGREGEADQSAGLRVRRRHSRLTRRRFCVKGDARRGHQRLQELLCLGFS